VIFSPEPSHDVLGMGGTLRRLVDQGHEVTIVYQTSGNLAVPDEEAAMAADLIADLAEADDLSLRAAVKFAGEVRQRLGERAAFEPDSPAVRRVKGLLRRGEARASMQACGVPAARLRFLDLNFYERGRYRQFAPGQEDFDTVARVLRDIAPHQIFATGDRDDPSSITAIAFDLVRRAVRSLANEPWFRDCRVWLYRGIETPWNAAEVDMAVPLSPRELAQKTQAIFHHRSQRNQTAVTTGLREPWQQAEQHNRGLAETYDLLGLANYEAIEAFQRWRP
jgi:glucosamine-6-phosphate deaminase